jgi:hypothetical protein
MTYKRPSIESRLKALVYLRLSKSPALRRKLCEEEAARQMTFPQFVAGCLAALIWVGKLAIFPLAIVPQTAAVQGPDGLLAAQSILGAVTTLYLASIISATLHASRNVTVLSHLPATDFRMALHSYNQQIWPLIGVSYAHLWVYLQYLTNDPRLSNHLELALPLTVGQLILYWATAVILVRYLPSGILNQSFINFAPYLVLAFCWQQTRLMPTAVNTSLWLLPSGWLNAILLWSDQPGGSIYYALLLPYLLWCGLAVSCVNGILGRYRIREFSIRRGEEIAVELEGSPTAGQQAFLDEQSAERNRLPPLESASDAAKRYREIVRSRRFIEQERWARIGWIEWLVFVSMSERSRIIIETLTSHHISWTSAWWTMLWLSGLAWSVGTLLNLGLTVGGILLVIGFIYLVNGFWPAFRLRSLGGMYGSQIYGLPLGIDETFSTFMKVALIRLGAALVVWIPSIIFLVRGQGQPLGDSVPIIVGVFVVASTLSVWIAFFQFGFGAEFAKGEQKFLWFVAVNVLGLSFLYGIGQIINSIASLHEMRIGLSVVMTTTTLNWLLFRAIYRHGTVDLVVFQTPYSERQLVTHELSEVQTARKVERRQSKSNLRGD